MPLGDCVEDLRNVSLLKSRNRTQGNNTVDSCVDDLGISATTYPHQNDYSDNKPKTMAVSKDTMHLSSPALLEKIDRLRDLNISRHVPLPQVRTNAAKPSMTAYMLTHITSSL